MSGAARARPARARPAAPRPADTALLNGVVYTADGARPGPGRGASATAASWPWAATTTCGGSATASTRLIDLGGRLVLPGFIDSHAHASETVGDVFGVRLKGLASLEEYVAAVRDFAADHPELPAIRGWGWSNVVAPGRGPTATALDAAVADRPALLISEDGHSLWANSLALRLAGVGPDTPDPANGVIEREPGGGRPMGTLREGAQHLVLAAVAPFTARAVRRGHPPLPARGRRSSGHHDGLRPNAGRRRTGLRGLRGPAARRRAHRALSRRLLAALRPAPGRTATGRDGRARAAHRRAVSRPTPSSSSPTASSRATRPTSTSPTPTLPATAASRNGRPRP